MLVTLLGTSTLYVGLLVIDPIASWAQTPVAALMGAIPLIDVTPLFMCPRRGPGSRRISGKTRPSPKSREHSNLIDAGVSALLGIKDQR